MALYSVKMTKGVLCRKHEKLWEEALTFPEKRGIIEKNRFWKVGKRMLKYTLAREGNFYKGNLHTHSTVSDGEQTP